MNHTGTLQFPLSTLYASNKRKCRFDHKQNTGLIF